MKRFLRRLAARHWWLGMTIAAWALLMFSSAPQRGFDRYGLHHVERVEAAHGWFSALSEGASLTDRVAAQEHLVSEPFYGPVSAVIPAGIWRLSADMDAPSAARLANMLLVALTAWCLFSIGRRAGGLLAGLGAGVSLIAMPRIWAAATAPGDTASVLLAFTLGAMAMAHARDRLAYLVPAVLSLALALLTTQLAWLLLLPWVFLTFFEARRDREGGLVASRPLTLWAPLVFPLAVVLALKVFPPFAADIALGPLDYLKAHVQLPREPTLYFGEVFAAERLPWHAAPVLVGITTPPTVLFLAMFGLTLASPLARWIRRLTSASSAVGPQDSSRVAALRLAWSMLILTLLLPLLMGTTHSHGVDLLALALPWCAVFAGVGLKAVMEVIAQRLQVVFAGRAWARFGTLAAITTLGWGLFVFALKDTQNAFPELESYYSWLVRGVDGAAELGMARNPHGPLPPEFLSELVDPEAEARLALVPDSEAGRRIIERYRSAKLVPAGLTPASLQNADIVVFRFDEQEAQFYDLLPDLFATIQSLDESDVRWLFKEGLPLFVALRLKH